MHMTARRFALVLMAALLAGCATQGGRAPAPVAQQTPVGPVVDAGVLEGAAYRIDIPADWNGELVVNAHGYVMVGTPARAPGVAREMAPLLARGFAVASSEYAQQGWVIDEAIADTERLRAHFVARHGTPKKTWLVGWSMGGLVALASAERHPRGWDGVVAMCGVAMPSETLFARAVLAPLAAFDALYPGVLPLGPGGLADPSVSAEPDGDAIEAAFAADEARAAAFAQRFDLPRADAASSLWLYAVVLREMSTRAGGFPVTSTSGADGTDGDEAALGVRIRRYTANPVALAYVRRTGALTGAAPVPVVVQPNAIDPIVPARVSSGYLALATAQGRAAQVHSLPGIGRGHCRFPAEAVVTALETLR
ncbi:MAG: alpha/beta fold hydrolase [Pseudoxanthomonas sp.]